MVALFVFAWICLFGGVALMCLGREIIPGFIIAIIGSYLLSYVF